MTQTLTPIAVVPHFMRLHEWIALEQGYYQQVGLDPILRDDIMHRVSQHAGSPYKQRPQDAPFLAGEAVANSACHWGSVCNAAAGMGKFVPDVYGVANFAIFVRPGSPIREVADLGDVEIGVGTMAGSHFTALETLEQHLPAEQIKVRNIGGPGYRLDALLRGEVEAANLLDPEIPIAESKGLRRVIGGQFKTLFWVSPGIPAATLRAYFDVLRRAEAELEREPGAYLHLWARNVPPILAGDHDYARFGTGERLRFEPYGRDEFERALAFAHRWQLDANVVDREFANLAAPVG